MNSTGHFFETTQELEDLSVCTQQLHQHASMSVLIRLHSENWLDKKEKCPP